MLNIDRLRVLAFRRRGEGGATVRGRELFAIPDVFEPVAAIAIGYPGNPDELSEDLRERELGERSRKPQSEFVFADKWGVPLP